MNDDELQAALSRRASTPLTDDQRSDVMRASRVRALEAKPVRRAVWPRLARGLAAMAAVIVLVLVTLPIVLSPPQVVRPSSTPTASSSATGPVVIHSAEDLAAMANDPTRTGQTVIAEAIIQQVEGVVFAPICTLVTPCLAGQIGSGSGSDRLLVYVGYRDAPENLGTLTETDSGARWLVPLTVPYGVSQVSAFRIESGGVEYLGAARLAPDGTPLSIDEVPAANEKTPTDNVYVVHGWWVEGFWPSCPVPEGAVQSPPTDTSYFCEGSWLAPGAIRSDHVFTALPGALQLPAGPIPDFATNQANQVGPIEANFLVRSAGCQEVLVANCPVWRLLGRLDDVAQSPTSTASPAPLASPSPTSSPSGELPIYSASELADLIGDLHWVGSTVLADAQIQPSDTSCPPPPQPCGMGELDLAYGDEPSFPVAGVGHEVTVGWRDATAQDGVQYDDGNGYRWVKRLDLPTDRGVFAFVVRQDSVEYLGRAKTAADGSPLAVSDLAGAQSDPSDDVNVVSAWLTTTPPAPCAFPQEGLQSPMPDISSYYCGGSWLTDERVDPPTSGLTIDGGLHVQNSAWGDFALPPGADTYGTAPVMGIYLVRNAGCPEVVTGDCPVWRMVGRVADSSVPVPTPSGYSSPPPGIRIPTGTPPPNSSPQPCPAAVRTAFLVADDTYGVATAGADGSAQKVVWPYGYSAVPDGDRVALLDEGGQILAHTSDYVSIGGGDMPDGSYNGCGGVTVVGPDGSSPPHASPSPAGSSAVVEYVHLAQALDLAQPAVNQFDAQLRSYAAGSYQSVHKHYLDQITSRNCPRV